MKVIAIVGTYRKGHIIDSAVDLILASAKEEGAEVSKIYLIDKHIEFCTNCRSCTQQDGAGRGQCPTEDDMKSLLDEMEKADAVVLASPMNFWTVTAVMKRFVERFVCYAYWPWGAHGPVNRIKRPNKTAVILVSSAAPATLARLNSRIVGLLKSVAKVMGAKTVGVLFMGLSAGRQSQTLTESNRKKARRLGKKLVLTKVNA